MSIFESTKQRFFGQILLSMKLPSLIPAIAADLARGDCAVVQLVSTSEAMLDRALADLSPEERAWLTRLFDEVGWVDVYRSLHPDTTDACYTWWSNRGQAWAKNVGWRLDYQIATPGTALAAKATAVYKDERFSDHAPLTVDYQIDA